MALELSDLKGELRVTHSHEDALIERKLQAAIAHVESYIGQTLASFVDGVPVPIEEAVLKLGAHLYEWRGVATEGALAVTPAGFYSLLYPYRSWHA